MKNFIEKDVKMKLANEVKELCEESNGRPVNYKVTAMVHFPDGVLNRRGSLIKVKAVDAEEAGKVARAQIEKNWPKVTKIEIMSAKKG